MCRARQTMMQVAKAKGAHVISVMRARSNADEISDFLKAAGADVRPRRASVGAWGGLPGNAFSLRTSGTGTESMLSVLLRACSLPSRTGGVLTGSSELV